MTIRLLAATTLVLCTVAASASQAQTSLKVMVFPSLSNLPSYAAQAKGNHQIVHAAVDNAVAMADVAGADVAVILGGDSGHNYLYVQPEIKGYEDIRGKTVAVDAPNTAYALLLYKMLDVKGVKKGDYQIKPVGGTPLRLKAMLSDKSYAASMLNPPFSITADKAGLRNLGAAADVVGPYQAGAAWIMRSWGRDNADTVVKYIQAHIEGLRWALNPANKAEAAALLAERLKLPPEIAARAYEHGLNPANGFAKDAKFNLDGFRNVLKLRAEMLGTWGGKPPAPDKYLDFSYYDRALSGM